MLGDTGRYKNHILLRIDFRVDVKIEHDDHRKLLMDLYRKLTKSYRFQKKYLGKLKQNVFIPYKTTVYHSSKSIESVVYVKEDERIAKGEKVQEYEKQILRYEVRVKDAHLYYMEKKKSVRERKLWAYFQTEVYKEYFAKYMFHIYHDGDFYKIDAARKKLKSSFLSVKDIIKLVDFLKQVSSHSIDTPLKKNLENDS